VRWEKEFKGGDEIMRAEKLMGECRVFHILMFMLGVVPPLNSSIQA
jgi:hypothetical protein